VFSTNLRWVCLKCGQANYDFYEDERNMKRLMEIEDQGADARNTCINCKYQRNPKTKVKLNV